MKSKVICIMLLVIACVISLRADVIYLKNGMYLKVHGAREKDGQVEYWIGGTRYTIAREAVDRIEAGSGPASSGSGGSSAVQDLTRRPQPSGNTPPHDKLSMPRLAGPNQADRYWNSLRERFVVNDSIDEMRLAEIERDPDSRASTNSYYLAGVMELQRGNPERASKYFAQAIQISPDRLELLEWNAIALGNQGRYAEAARELEHATALQPNSADLQRLLGLTEYNADRTGDAIVAWKRAEAISADPATQRLLKKAERELEVEEKSRRKESRHFTLRYQGDRNSADLQQQLVDTLEQQFADLSRQLGYEPGENIIVILYTQKEFTDITEAPSWAGALNDGKLRIPMGGINGMNSELQRVLKHELTHSFVNSLAAGRCPTWLNEGLAQAMEPRSSSQYAPQLAQLFQQKKEIPLGILEHSFTRFSALQAEVAYAESLSAVDYLRDRYGLGEIVRMMRNIGSGEPVEEALKRSTGQDYDGFQQRIGEYLQASGKW